MLKIRVDDEVIVRSGSDRGARGKVQRILKDGRYIVAGVNMRTKHVKPNPQAGVQGGREQHEGPVHVSNLALFNPDTGKMDRVGFRYEEEDGQRVKVRYYKSTGQVVPDP